VQQIGPFDATRTKKIDDHSQHKGFGMSPPSDAEGKGVHWVTLRAVFSISARLLAFLQRRGSVSQQSLCSVKSVPADANNSHLHVSALLLQLLP